MSVMLLREPHAGAGDPALSPGARLIAVNISEGGIPRFPQGLAYVDKGGLRGDIRAHEKHRRPDRAVSILDYEIILQLVHEGFRVWPGRMGENLTALGMDVQHMEPGTQLQIGNVIVQLEQPRKPCYVLDAIDPRLKDVVVGRCGFLASVIQPGPIESGARIQIHREPCAGIDEMNA
jgi:MOSC domain-containing protein YiiM